MSLWDGSRTKDQSTNNNTNNTVHLFEFATPPEEPCEADSRRAHASSKSSIEVVAVVKADKFTIPFIQYSGGVRYKANPYSTRRTNPSSILRKCQVGCRSSLRTYCITYRDEQQTGREREYSWNEILKEALLIREQYCGLRGTDEKGMMGPETSSPLEQQQQNQQKPPPPPREAACWGSSSRSRR